MKNANPKRRRILLADDDESLQNLVKRAVEKYGHELIEVTEAASVLAVAASSQPDVIVLDIEFPGADGRDLLASLKADPRTSPIPVIVWSGRRTNESDSRISLELGAEDYVEKNDPALLIRKLERVLLRVMG
jgi:CheY-like chemotaxis protein